MFHPQIARSLQDAIAVLMKSYNRIGDTICEGPDMTEDLADLYGEMAATYWEMAEGYKRLLRHVQAVNGEPPAPAAASTSPAPTAPAAPAAVDMAGVTA